MLSDSRLKSGEASHVNNITHTMSSKEWKGLLSSSRSFFFSSSRQTLTILVVCFVYVRSSSSGRQWDSSVDITLHTLHITPSQTSEGGELCTPPCHQHQPEKKNWCSRAVFYTHSHGRSTGFCEMYIIDGSWYEKKNFNVIKIVVGVEFKIKSAQRTVELSEREGDDEVNKGMKIIS